MSMDTVHEKVENRPEMETSQIVTLLQLNLFLKVHSLPLLENKIQRMNL